MVFGLLIANVAVGVYTLAVDHVALYNERGFIPTDPTLLDAATSMFLHGSFWHLLGNLFFLWMFGDNVEDVIGSAGFVVVYIATGLAAVAAHSVFNATSTLPLIGASGAISGLIGVYCIFFPHVRADLVLHLGRFELKSFDVTTAGAAAFWFGEQLLFATVATASGIDDYIGIAFWAHVGGFASGLLIGLLFRRVGYVDRYIAETKRHPLIGYNQQAPGPDDAYKGRHTRPPE